MTPDLVLNNLSLTPAPDRQQARQRMSELLTCIAELGLLSVSGVVRISMPLDGVELAPDYLIGVWRGDTEVDLDLRRLYKSRIGVGPYLTDEEVRSLKGDEDIEIRIDGIVSRGCEAAYLLDGVALSLRSAPIWDRPELDVEIIRMHVDSSIIESTGSMRHISRREHLENHRPWIDGLLRNVNDDDDLWNRRDELFPHLLFADAVRQELRDEMRVRPRFRAILKRLGELEEYFAAWAGDQFEANGVRSKCTPETPQSLKDNRLALTRFCSDGVPRLFSYHVHFTPGAGRIYFCPDGAIRRAHVGFVGEKFVL
jgi:hypothetical protein